MMSMPLRKEDFEALFVAAPAPEWTTAFAAVEELKDFEKLVDAFDLETKFWILGTRKRFKEGSSKMLGAIQGAPRDDIFLILAPHIHRALEAVDTAIAAHAVPFHERPEIALKLGHLADVSGPPMRFLRKQLKRIEDTRLKRHNAVVDMYYGLLALRSELESAASERTYSTSDELGKDLRKLIA